jgi:phage baseplate assembly protein gpV
VTRLAQAVAEVARREVARLRVCEVGVVTSVFTTGGGGNDHACAVQLRAGGLVLPRVPLAVGMTGAASPPGVGDLVAVLFAGGDLHAPLIVGRLYHDQLEPPDHSAAESVLRLPAGESDAAARIDVVATAPDADARALTVSLEGEAAVTMRLTPGEVVITVGDAELTLRQPGGSAGMATVKVKDSSVEIDGGGDVSVTATGRLTLSGASVEITGDTTVKVQGQTLELN